MDRLGPTSTLSPPPVDDNSSLFTAASPCSKAADTVDAPPKTQELPAANCAPTTTASPAADLARLAAELQALAEETARLRQGLDRLVTVTEAAPRWPGPLPAGREGDFSWSGCYNRPLGSVSRADEGGVLALWLQQRLLGAVEALLE